MSAVGIVVARRSTPLWLWAAFGAVLGVAIAVLLKHTGNPADYFRYPVLPGQFLFVLVKLSGLTAMALVVFQVVLGLTRRILPFELTLGQHKALGMATLAMIAFHVIAFVTAVSIRNQLPALDLLWPSFHGYYRTWLSAGLFGLWALALGLVAVLRGGAWRRLHWLMLVGFVLAYLHSLMVGSETRAGPMAYVYAAFVLAVVGALALRIRAAWWSNRSAS